jgi:hypothetical protein
VTIAGNAAAIADALRILSKMRWRTHRPALR